MSGGSGAGGGAAVLLAAAAGYGVFLLYSAIGFGWRGLGPGPRRAARPRRRALRVWLTQAGLDEVVPAQFLVVVVAVGVCAAALAFGAFGGVVAPAVVGLAAAASPLAISRARRQRRQESAREAWPRMLEQLRLRTGSLGRSIPQALFEVGATGPVELRRAFLAGEREWLVTTDFARTVGVLKAALSDPTADAALETLLVAHEIGGTDLDRRLAALVVDRTADLEGRKDALAKQAGVRFARRFVLAVPVGMAAAGLSIGTGRAAYGTTPGQLAVVVGVCALAACWLWAGRLLRLPEGERVLDGRPR